MANCLSPLTTTRGNDGKPKETGSIHTAHTNLPVPLIYVGGKDVEFKEGGKLSDLAPTMLSHTVLISRREMSGDIFS